MDLTTLQQRWTHFSASRQGKNVIRWGRLLLNVGILAYLFYQFSKLGWGTIISSLPTTPWFYLIFLVMYFTLPITEAVIYGLTWKLPAWRLFPATLKKRVYNKDVLGYSGEVYLYFWAKKAAAVPDREVWHGIKDNTIISSIVSTLIAFGLLGIFFFTRQVVLPDSIAEHNVSYIVAAMGLGIVLAVIGYKFRKSILALPAKLLLVLAGLHVVRQLIVLGFQLLQWNIVVPEVPMQVWFTFLSVQIIMSRIAILPSRDLLFLGAGLELSQALHVPEAAIAGMLAASSLLDKSLNMVLFTMLSARERLVPPPTESVPDVLEAEAPAGEF